MVAKWETTGKKDAGEFRIFKAEEIRRKHPLWNKEGDFVVLNSPEWVNIIPLTVDNKVVLIEQYRHGIDDLTIEVPGGLVEINEEPILAGKRECIEETGYTGTGEAVLIGVSLPNPAFLNNKCYHFVWYGCSKVSEQALDCHEDIRVIEVPLNEVKEYILDGRINHSLVLTAFFYYFLRNGY